LSLPGTKACLPEVRKIQEADHPTWAFECPQRIREHAFSDAVAAVKNAKVKSSKEGFQLVHFRKKKDPTQRFGFDKQSLKEDFVFSPKYRASFYATEKVLADKEGTEIIKESGRFFLIIPKTRPIQKPDSQRFSVASLDPGIRTFQTIFSPELEGKIGQQDFKEIYRLCIRMDKLTSKLSKARCKAKQNMKRALSRIRWAIKDKVNELHHKTTYFLVTMYDVILLPTFETSQMVTKLRSKSARAMLTFAHYRFKKFLKAKAEEYSCTVVETNEAYTSKTCSYCGTLHNIGSKKVLKCTCGITVDRDINGARGNFIKNFHLALLALTTLNKGVTVNEC
jgi:putative transposase